MSDPLKDCCNISIADLIEITQSVGPLVPGTLGQTIVQVAGITLQAADGVQKVLSAAELREIQRQRAIGLASGQAAYQASKRAGK